jgi:hypothetical protein
LVQHWYSAGIDIPMSACVCLLQMNNPLHLWKLWDPEVRHQRRCFAGNDAIMVQKIQRLRKVPPAAHTIAGEQSRQSSVRFDVAWSGCQLLPTQGTVNINIRMGVPAAFVTVIMA